MDKVTMFLTKDKNIKCVCFFFPVSLNLGTLLTWWGYNSHSEFHHSIARSWYSWHKSTASTWK